MQVRGGWVPEGFMRPGCVYLTFDVFQPGSKEAVSVEDVVHTLLSLSDFWKKHQMIVKMVCGVEKFLFFRFNLMEKQFLYFMEKSAFVKWEKIGDYLMNA